MPLQASGRCIPGPLLPHLSVGAISTLFRLHVQVAEPHQAFNILQERTEAYRPAAGWAARAMGRLQQQEPTPQQRKRCRPLRMASAQSSHHVQSA